MSKTTDKEAPFFKTDDGDEKEDKENNIGNYFKIIGTLIIFYFGISISFWGNYELGIYSAQSSLIYNLVHYGVHFILILTMIILGNKINKKILTNEFYQEIL